MLLNLSCYQIKVDYYNYIVSYVGLKVATKNITYKSHIKKFKGI